LDDAVLVRYLRAREGSIEKAAAMLTATLEWRREFGFPEASFMVQHAHRVGCVGLWNCYCFCADVIYELRLD
ncbi:unnamed protein product, partial [Ectocarpus sp. 12 AP-2014]